MDIHALHVALVDLRPEDNTVATIANWHDTPTKRNGFALNPCSYAIAILINRRLRFITWGVGYSPSAIPQQVIGLQTLLQAMPQGRRLEVHAHSELERYIEFDGIGRHAMRNRGRAKSGKPLSCYPAIAEIIDAYDRRRWSFIPYKDLSEAPGYEEAEAIAKGKAKAAALQHKADHAPTSETYPKPIILQEFVHVFPG